MSLSLVEALSQVDLEPGRTYRCQVKDRMVELRVREAIPPEFLPAPLNESDIMIMLDPWVELPMPKPIGRVVARLAPPPPPDIPEIPPEDEMPLFAALSARAAFGAGISCRKTRSWDCLK